MKLKDRVKKAYFKLKLKIKKNPFLYFSLVLGALLLLIVIGNFLRKPELEEIKQIAPKEVKTYTIGQAPTLKFQGKVEKSGTITIVAQMAGVVNNINVAPGLQVDQGHALVNLSSNYTGSNIPSLQQQLAWQNYNFNKENLDTQKEIIQKQIEIAKQTNENSSELRIILQKSVEESQAQLDLNESILSTIQQNLNTLKQATQSAANDELILSTKQLKAQFLSAVNQLKSLIRTNEYQGSDDQPPANLVNLQKELTLKQLDIQEKSLDLSLEISRLNYQIASVTASLMNPAAPFAGIVEKTYVFVGEYVNPGQKLVTITGDVEQLDVVVSLPQNIASNISKLEPAKIYLDSGPIEVLPQHITLEPLSDQQHRIIYHLPLEEKYQTFNNQYLQIEIPLGYPDSVASIPSIPIDAVYQLQNEAYIYLAENNTAVSKKIELGKVFGSNVQVLSGLNTGSKLIITRNVTEGDSLKEI